MVFLQETRGNGKRCIVLVQLFVVLQMTRAQSSYCTVCRDHTMCRFPGVAGRCNAGGGGSFVRGLYPGDKQRILQEHNRLRNLVASGGESRGRPGPQPPAADMRRLVWDNELANIAQRWADQCLRSQHDTCRNTLSGVSVGQNVASQGCQGNKTSDWGGRIRFWYSEVDQWSRYSVDRYQFAMNTGHYSQVVWGATARVGCGFVRFTSGSQCTKVYVCNYAPSGNFRDQPIYTRGNPRTRCQRVTAPNRYYPALC